MYICICIYIYILYIYIYIRIYNNHTNGKSASKEWVEKGQVWSALMGSLQIYFFDRGTFWILPLTCFYIPKSAWACLFPQSVKIRYFCSGPIRVDPIRPQPSESGSSVEGGRNEGRGCREREKCSADRDRGIDGLRCRGNTGIEERGIPLQKWNAMNTQHVCVYV